MQGDSITQDLCLPNYKITKIQRESETLRIHVKPYKRKKFVCSGCRSIHDGTINSCKDVTVEDLKITGKRVWLIVTKRRVRCPLDGKLHVELVDWIKPRARVTNRFAKDVYRLTSITTNTEAGWYLGIDDERVYRIDLETLEELAKKKLEPIPVAKNMSVDEVAWRLMRIGGLEASQCVFQHPGASSVWRRTPIYTGTGRRTEYTP